MSDQVLPWFEHGVPVSPQISASVLLLVRLALAAPATAAGCRAPGGLEDTLGQFMPGACTTFKVIVCRLDQRCGWCCKILQADALLVPALLQPRHQGKGWGHPPVSNVCLDAMTGRRYSCCSSRSSAATAACTRYWDRGAPSAAKSPGGPRWPPPLPAAPKQDRARTTAHIKEGRSIKNCQDQEPKAAQGKASPITTGLPTTISQRSKARSPWDAPCCRGTSHCPPARGPLAALSSQ